MAQPTKYSSTHVPLVAFSEGVHNSGVFEFDADLNVAEVHLGSSGTLTRAVGELYAGPIPSAIPGAPPIRQQLTRAEIERRYPTHKRFAIGYDHPNPAGRQYVALGYLTKPGVEFSVPGGDPPRAEWREKWQLESALGREAMARGRVLQGQWRIGEELAAALTEDELWYQLGNSWFIDLTDGWHWGDIAEPLKCVQSERLCFNPGGHPNRFRNTVRVPVAGRYGFDDHSVDLFVFTDPDGPHAEMWTYHDALRYLWHVSMQDAAVTAEYLMRHDLPGGITQHLHGVAPDDLGPVYDPGWAKSMVRYCETFTPEGMTIFEALAILNGLCGLRWREEIDSNGGEPFSRMWFWVPGDDTHTKLLELELDGETRTAGGQLRDVETDVLRRNNVSHAKILHDGGGLLNHVQVIGDRRWITLRLNLSPLWLPAEEWDNVEPEAVEGLVESATGDDAYTTDPESTFYARHHPSSGGFFDDENAIIGRLYGVDFAAELNPEDYDRDAPPYNEYGAVAWGALGRWGGDGAPTDQVRRRRRIMPLASVDASGRSIGVVLEVSCDAGETWHYIGVREFKTVPDRSAILIAAKDLLAFAKDVFEEGDQGVDNYYHAYLTRVFRARITALVELDERVVGDALDPWTPLGWTGPLGPLSVSRTVLRNDEFLAHDTQRFLDHDFPGEGERDDTLQALRFGSGLLRPNVTPIVTGSPQMPWLDCGPARYPIGTPIGGIRRSAVNSDHDLPFTVWLSAVGLCPEVVGKIFRQSTEGASTELILEAYTFAPAYA